jgi:hypothetical protein
MLAALITSARMRGVLHAAEATTEHVAAIRAGSEVGLVTLTLDGRVVWFPGALSAPGTLRRVDLTDLPLFEALAVVFRRPPAGSTATESGAKRQQHPA